jgi:NADP-dependent 3-hydroxy acid dehydrogenase YdfG
MKINVLVTGASSGIGAACVESWIRAGAAVIAVSRNKKKLESFSKKFSRSQVFPIACDVSSEIAVDKMRRVVGKHFKSLDILINNAGAARFEPIAETLLENWNTAIGSILTGSFLVTKAMLPLLMSSKKAHIFNICSTASKKGFINCGAYSAAKFGQLGFTEVLREEMRALNIKVTAIIPGAADTPFWDVQETGFDRKQMLQADDIAEAVRFAYRQPKHNLVEEIILKPSCGDF